MNRRVYLFVDFGGPLMDDNEVEKLRKKSVLEACKKSGVLLDMATVDARVLDVSESDFEAKYDEAKKVLKKSSEESEAYNDINRLAITLSFLINGPNYKKLVSSVKSESSQKFWEVFSTPIKKIASKSMKKDSLKALKNILGKHELQFHLVIDNWPDLFHRSFEPVIKKKFLEYGLPKMEYRHIGNSRKSNNCLYVSGEGWGNKKFPKTWDLIFSDVGVKIDDVIFFVDNTVEKLDGFRMYAEQNGIKYFNPIQFFDGKENKSTMYQNIISLKNLEVLMLELVEK